MKEKFEFLLDKDEEIKWLDGINISAYVKKNFLKTFLFGLFPPVALLMLGVPYSLVLLILSLLKVIPMLIGIAHFIFAIVVCFAYIFVLIKGAKNTFFCITNKRIIKRSGAFTNDFVHYTLKNIGTIRVDGCIFDSKDNNPSASLVITVKDYHTNTDGNTKPDVLIVESLNDAYKAYKTLNELTEGNNEVFRVKVEK